ncbi:PrsW family glutamic-type intramembrane protease [Candidatus Methanoperedens nitratireducens]|uniref:PrsW family glutamic-type intramembrane protease n=1 Tax=Candidatus Methanoperedens nitratireducens TaxID=1392998 RepID=UPI0015C7A398|nr:PrsW family glutamic-type intramembrane protease [Candidatus Methanoperedens nitroreducens]
MAIGESAIIPLHRPGSKEKLFFLSAGLIVSIPFTVFVNAFSSRLCFLLPVFYAEICATAIFAPFIEEFAKVYPLFYRHGETEKSIFTLGFLVGMGFGITEFMIYVFGAGAPVSVRFLGIFFHAASTSITAYGIAIKRTVPFYMVAVLLHLLYNFFTFLGPLWLIGGPVALITVFYLSWYLYGKTQEKLVI